MARAKFTKEEADSFVNVFLEHWSHLEGIEKELRSLAVSVDALNNHIAALTSGAEVLAVDTGA